jgi:hypothetical protein
MLVRVVLIGLIVVILLAVGIASVRFPHVLRVLARAPLQRFPDAQTALDFHYPTDISVDVTIGGCPPLWEWRSASDYEEFLSANVRSALGHDGIILQYYGSDYDFALWQHQPYTIANFGLTGVAAWCERGDMRGLEIARRHADWLVENAVQPFGYTVWTYDFPYDSDNPPGWYSGFANAFGIVLLAQMHALTGDERYAETAAAATEIYDVDMADGGVRWVMEDGTVWLEEYAYPSEREPHHVLNGYLLALSALDYYSALTRDMRFQRYVEDGIDALRATMDDFDMGTYTLYQLNPPLPPTSYSHAIHVRGLRWFCERTGEAAFCDTAERWAAMTS